MSYGVDHRHGSDLALLWRRPAAEALIRPLAWEPPYASDAALKRQNPPPKKKEKRKKERREGEPSVQILGRWRASWRMWHLSRAVMDG